MARKRMISPNIWGSLSFSKLSDFAKLVFIGLFSNADDDGKGCADVSMIKSTLFPRDKQRRLTDIENALSEIAQNMSIKFYEIEGDSYYILTAWQKWQTINRPTPSTIPNPPATMGERGHNTQNYNFNDNSLNTHGALTDNSLPNIKEVNIREDNIPPNTACACEKDQTEFELKLHAFCTKWGIAIDSNSPLLADFDFDKLDKAYSESKTYLQNKDEHPNAQSLDWIVRNYLGIIGGKKFKDKKFDSGDIKKSKGYWDDALDKLGRLD